MKTNLLALATLLLISIAGCEQKPTLVDKPTEAPLEKQAIQEPAVKTNSVADPEPAQKTNITQETPTKAAPKVQEISTRNMPTIVKETTEQSLAEVAKHGREITKTQESKSRTRAQISEDEMLKDLENSKKAFKHD